MANIQRRRRDVIGRALEAIRDGRMSVEAALRLAAKGGLRSRGAFARLALTEGPARRPTVNSFPARKPQVASRAVATVRRRLATLEGVRSVHWGVRQTRGRSTGEPCVVVFVDEKAPATALRLGRRRLIPKAVTVQHAGVKVRVTIDVQPVGAPGVLQALESIRVGTNVAIGTAKKTLGSLGGVVVLADGRLGAITAGHVVLMAKGAELVASTVTSAADIGRPMERSDGGLLMRVDETADLAIVGPLLGNLDAISGDLLPLRDPTTADMNHRVWVTVLREFAPVAAYIEGVDVSASFFRADGPGEITIDGLVAIDAVTQRGDSGGPVVDDLDNVVGFVVGSDGLRTYLMPARRGLDALDNSGD